MDKLMVDLWTGCSIYDALHRNVWLNLFWSGDISMHFPTLKCKKDLPKENSEFTVTSSVLMLCTLHKQSSLRDSDDVARTSHRFLPGDANGWYSTGQAVARILLGILEFPEHSLEFQWRRLRNRWGKQAGWRSKEESEAVSKRPIQ